VPDLAPRETILSLGIEELAAPAVPGWAAGPLPMRRAEAARIVASVAAEEPMRLRVALPEGPGYKLIFAHLRRDWRAIGLDAQPVPDEAAADLRFVDAVAPANLATWYLRRFSCGASAVCSAEADALLATARETQNPAERQALLAQADRLLTDITPFISLTAPVRWSLVSPRLSGFQANPFARRFLGGLVAVER
jgi:peptide/nickel transport system substrate-binding protein